VALADKVDTLVSLFAVGERPTGTRDPFGLRRQAHGLLRIAVDLPELTGFDVVVDLKRLVEHALELLVEQDSKAPRPSLPREFDPRVVLDPAEPASLHGFLMDRARYLLGQRGYAYDEVNAVLRPSAPGWDRLNMLDQRRRLDALRAVRGSADFEALAVAFKRVTNLARELKQAPGPAADLLKEPAEMALLIEYEQRGAAMRQAIAACDYQRAFKLASGFRPAVDRFFLEVFVMVDEQSLREQRLALLYRLHALLLDLADIAEIVPRPQ
jgi:glycyl-tRNA synthetase beta chain